MSYVIRFGSNYRIFSEDDISVSETLPVKTYTVAKNDMSGEYFLEVIKPFEMPAKFYGDTEQKAERILKTFADRKGSLGVHLDGVKGSGKTLLAKYVSKLGAEQGIPTIVVNNEHCGDQFNKFIQSINIPCIILFDEFEKVYGYQEQNKILTLFDGVYPSKKLFMLTTNDSYHVNNFLKNRPGRIYYSLKFDTLAQEFIKEYCEDNLNNKAEIDNILKYTSVFSFFNFDMLAAAVEEMNRYNESLQEVLNYLNILPENKNNDTYSIVINFMGHTIQLETHYKGFNANTFEYDLSLESEDLAKLKNEPCWEILKRLDTEGWGYICFDGNDITDFDPATNAFTFTLNENNALIELVVTRNMNMDFDIRSKLF